MRRIELVGRTFGHWTVLSFAGGAPQSKWNCRCACGTIRAVAGVNLRSGHSTSCGKCLRSVYAKNSAKTRDFTGAKNPRAQAAKRNAGADYIPSSDVWYKRASSVFYSAKNRGVSVRFASAMEFATYIKAIAPDTCPVFGRKFDARGGGFSPWSPSIDKINPKRGYVRGNIQIISMLANSMKRDANAKQLRQFANWILNAQDTP